MSRVKKIRESVDGTLDRWQIRVEAMEARLDATQEQAMERVEARKRAYHDAIDKAKGNVEASKLIATQEKQLLKAKLDEARVQVALGKAESREQFDVQRKEIRRQFSSLESSVDAELDAFDKEVDESLDEMAQDLVTAADMLDAEMDAAVEGFAAMQSDAKADVQAGVQGIKDNIGAFKAKIKTKRTEASANRQAFESEFDEGWSHIKSAFRNLG